ncbi:MAG: hypothetical protein HY438_01195 [DPANN group archaeon]|nr:hypothetical protein [DPANN group archaeon]
MGETYGLEKYVTSLDARGNIRTVTLQNWCGEERNFFVVIDRANYSYVIDHTAQDVLPLGGIVVIDRSPRVKLVVPIREFKPEVQKYILGQVKKDVDFVNFVSFGRAITSLTDRIKKAAKS